MNASSLQQPLADAAKGRAMNWIGPKTLAREYVFVPDAMRLAVALARLLGAPRMTPYGEAIPKTLDWLRQRAS